MKKKALMAVLSVCAAILMTACGENVDMSEAEEIVITEENKEDDVQAEAEAKAQEETEEQARLKEANECYEAGRKSFYGLDGARTDLEDAYTNFRKARELGNTDANFYLGVLTDWYQYPEQDLEQARAYYEQSEDNPYAQITLGFLYYNFQIGTRDEEGREKGKALFQAVVDRGVVEGYVGLAADARVEEDYGTALEYYQKVVAEGTEQLYIVTAMKGIANMYLNGEGVEKDGAKVIEWYTKAVDLGDSEAMLRIAQMYQWGNVVEQSNDKAMEWYQKAADAGDEKAKAYVESMKGR